MLKVLEPFIRSGRIHLIPDPLDYDIGYRDEIKTILESDKAEVVMGPIDEESARSFAHSEEMRAIKRLTSDDLKKYISQRMPESERLNDSEMDAVIRIWKKEMEDDPLASLDTLASSKDSGQLMFFRGFARETGLYVATLTGSIIYTDSDTQWARLHETDGVRQYKPSPSADVVVQHLSNLSIKLPTRTYFHQVAPEGAADVRTLLKRTANALREDSIPVIDLQALVSNSTQIDEDGLVSYKLRASVPLNGFQRMDVTRLILTFGRQEDVVPVKLCLFLEAVSHQN